MEKETKLILNQIKKLEKKLENVVKKSKKTISEIKTKRTQKNEARLTKQFKTLLRAINIVADETLIEFDDIFYDNDPDNLFLKRLNDFPGLSYGVIKLSKTFMDFPELLVEHLKNKDLNVIESGNNIVVQYDTVSDLLEVIYSFAWSIDEDVEDLDTLKDVLKQMSSFVVK